MTSILREDQYFDNEVEFCIVHGAGAMNELERVLLKNRISYFIRQQEKSILQKIFKRGKVEDIFVVRINGRDVENAIELAQDIPGVEITGEIPEQDWSPRAKLERMKAEGEEKKEFLDDEE